MMERDGVHYLLIGDIGDNRGKRPDIQVHVVKEPAVPFETPIVDTLPNDQVGSYVLRYADGQRDAESLFFDPIDKQLNVISKREVEVGVYTTVQPELPTDQLTLYIVRSEEHTY